MFFKATRTESHVQKLSCMLAYIYIGLPECTKFAKYFKFSHRDVHAETQ